MKNIKYLILTSAVALSLSGCYEDKGTYATEDWSCIESIEGMTLPNIGVATSYTLLEDATMSITPKITLKLGIDPSQIEYSWIMGGDTIGKGKDLNWQVVQTETMVVNGQGELNFWLAINNKATGEKWQQFLMTTGNLILKFKIVPTRTPQIGVMVYAKEDGSMEWGSLKGDNKSTPENFSSIYTDMYEWYNPTRKISGTYAAATMSGGDLIIYTNSSPDYGALIQTTSGSNYPLGLYKGNPGEEVFFGAPNDVINTITHNDAAFQSALIGTSLYTAKTSSMPYQIIFPNSSPSQSNVAQIMDATPFHSKMHFAVQRATNGEMYQYVYSEQYGYKRTPLVDATGSTLKADKLIGVFRQPTIIKKPIKIFVVVKQGATYNLYSYLMTALESGAYTIDYLNKVDVTSWAGGITDATLWMTTANEVPLNYLYIIKGNEVWRTSYESQSTPSLVKSFSDPISTVNPGLTSPDGDEIYTAVFTYNASSKSSKMHVLDFKSANVDALTNIEQTIPGRVVKYIPRY